MSDLFADLMAKLDQSMVIVTTIAGHERSGCLVGFHSQSSIDPPRYALWISRANHTHAVARRASVFAVHIIPADRHDLAELFGGATGDDIDKLEHCEWTPGPEGVPLLDGCPDRFVGRRTAWADADGDHSGVLLEPIDVQSEGDGPWLRLTDVLDIDAGHDPED